MRWPYKITEDPKDEKLLNDFKSHYFNGRSDPFYGTPEDYKARRILIYSPTTNQAVVCQPAYFLWGDTEVDRYIGAGRNNESGINMTDSDYINFKYDNETEHISAIVSPDAAYYLGVLNLTKDEQDFYDNKNDGNPASKALALAGISPNPQPRDCYYVFVDDNIPLGVVTTMQSPATKFDTVIDPWNGVMDDNGHISVITRR